MLLNLSHSSQIHSVLSSYGPSTCSSALDLKVRTPYKGTIHQFRIAQTLGFWSDIHQPNWNHNPASNSIWRLVSLHGFFGCFFFYFPFLEAEACLERKHIPFQTKISLLKLRAYAHRHIARVWGKKHPYVLPCGRLATLARASSLVFKLSV